MAINSSTAPGNGGNGRRLRGKRVKREKVKNILRKKRKKVESPLRVKRNKVESVVESAMYGKQGNGGKKKLPLFRWFLRIQGQKQ